MDVIFDIDGTLANCDHRLHHIRGKPKNFKKFMAGIPDDTVIEPIRDILWGLQSGIIINKIILVTGRSEEYRTMTEAWLENNYICFDWLFMRSNDDFRADYIVKDEIVDLIKSRGLNPVLAFEDRTRCVEMYREAGIICCQVADGDY